MSGEDKITITLTRHEWRVLAVAAAKVKRTAYIAPTDYLEAGRLAFVLAAYTGKETGK